MSKEYILFSCESGYRPEFSWLPYVMEKVLADTGSQIMFFHLGDPICYMIVECGDAFALGKARHAFASEAMAKANACKRFPEYLDEQRLEGDLWEVVAMCLKNWHDTIISEGMKP